MNEWSDEPNGDVVSLGDLDIYCSGCFIPIRVVCRTKYNKVSHVMLGLNERWVGTYQAHISPLSPKPPPPFSRT